MIGQVGIFGPRPAIRPLQPHLVLSEAANPVFVAVPLQMLDDCSHLSV